jgi:hypothetical protein
MSRSLRSHFPQFLFYPRRRRPETKSPSKIELSPAACLNAKPRAIALDAAAGAARRSGMMLMPLDVCAMYEFKFIHW